MKHMKFHFLSLALTMLALAGCGSAAKLQQTQQSQQPQRPLCIIYTNDTHCHIDKPLGFAQVAALKQQYKQQGYDVVLVDDGDFLQGTVYGAMDQGRSIIKLMNAAGYDLASVGNHEIDYGMNVFMQRYRECNFPLTGCNFWNADTTGAKTTRVTPPYVLVPFGNYKVAFVGILTPETYSKGTPTNFKDAQGHIIYNFESGNAGADLYASVQQAVDEARKQPGVRYVIALGHLGLEPGSGPWMSHHVIEHTTGIDAFIDGHSHNVVALNTTDDTNLPQYARVPNLVGDSIVLTQTGCYFGHIGVLTVDDAGHFTSTLLDDAPCDSAVATLTKVLADSIDGLLGQPIATTAIDFTIEDSNHDRRVRSQSTNMGNLVADGFYYYANNVNGIGCDFAFVAGGGVRTSIPAGIWTYKDCKAVSPFGNRVYVAECSGQTIKDLLEWGAMFAPTGENGNFIHPAGLRYSIDSTIVSTVRYNDNMEWAGRPTGAYRVHDIELYDRNTGTFVPLDTAATYRVCSLSYYMVSGGGGMTMFAADPTFHVVLSDLDEDYISTAVYLQAFANQGNLPVISSASSPLAALKGYPLNYEEPFDKSRISFGR